MKTFTYMIDKLNSEFDDAIINTHEKALKAAGAKYSSTPDVVIITSKDHLGYAEAIAESPANERPSVVVFLKHFGNTIEEATRIDYLLSNAGIKVLVCNLPFIRFETRAMFNSVKGEKIYGLFYCSSIESAMQAIEISDTIMNIENGSIIDEYTNEEKRGVDMAAVQGEKGFWFKNCNLNLFSTGRVAIKSADSHETIEIYGEKNKKIGIIKQPNGDMSMCTDYDFSTATERTMQPIELGESLALFYDAVAKYFVKKDKNEYFKAFDRMHCESRYTLRVHNIIDKMLLNNIINERIGKSDE